jgi:SAM-dependent methyltransferase
VKELTTVESWEQGYINRRESTALALGWRHYTNVLIARRIETIDLHGKRILEIGAGDSQWLPYLAQRHLTSQFAGLDYSISGCERLAARLSNISTPMPVEVHHQDMFAARSPLHGQFDLVLSFGVIEHFSDLSGALTAKRRYLRQGGFLFSLIPNMAGSLGTISKVLDRATYDMHFPHDWETFSEGHLRAGLRVISGGYLGSTNFGVLSSSIRRDEGAIWHLYVFLTRLTKAIWFIESRLGDLPGSKLFSPYIYAISTAR